jgi:hypothetical protein
MKEECAKQEHQQDTVSEQRIHYGRSGRYLHVAYLYASTSREVVVDVLALDRHNGEDRGDGQHRCGDKDGAIPEQVTDTRDEERANDVSGRVEGLILAELSIE